MMKRFCLVLLALTPLLAVPAARADYPTYNVSFTFVSNPNPDGLYFIAVGDESLYNDGTLPPGEFYDYGDATLWSNDPNTATGYAFSSIDDDGECLSPGTSPAGPTVTGNLCFPPDSPGTFNFEIFSQVWGQVDVYILPNGQGSLIGVNGTDDFNVSETNGATCCDGYFGTLTIYGDIGGVEFAPEPTPFVLLGTGLVGLAALMAWQRRAARTAFGLSV
jgi:hypothetical protein